MEFVETALGITIPDDKLSMEFFRTAGDIARTFAGGDLACAAQPPAAAPQPAEPPLLVFGDPSMRPSRDGVNALVDSGEIMSGADGCVAFMGRPFALYGYFTRLFSGEAMRVRAAPRRYPTLLALSDMQKTDYFKSFPQHATFCTCLEHDTATLQAFVADVKQGRELASATQGRLEAPATVLPSALCYHCYLELAGRTLPQDLVVLTTQGSCFRNERGAFRTLDRCYEFTMREIVMMGNPNTIALRRMELMRRSATSPGCWACRGPWKARPTSSSAATWTGARALCTRRRSRSSTSCACEWTRKAAASPSPPSTSTTTTSAAASPSRERMERQRPPGAWASASSAGSALSWLTTVPIRRAGRRSCATTST
jgi:hypothetical protein